MSQSYDDARAVADREAAAAEFGDDPLAGVEAFGGHALYNAGDRQ